MTLMLAGRMHHIDSLGNDIHIGPNAVKVMHSGAGLFHGGTCFDGARFLQIWIVADDAADLTPTVEVATFDAAARRSRWQATAAPAGEAAGGTIGLRQQAWVDRGVFIAGSVIDLPHRVDDAASFIYVADGIASLGGVDLATGDTLSIARVAQPIVAVTDLELILIAQPAQTTQPTPEVAS